MTIADNQAFQTVHFDGDLRFLIICDHTSNHIPAEYAGLGLSQDQLAQHIAYDAGAFEVASQISDRLRCPLVAARFSRLLVDPNRGLDDPTLITKLSDGAVIAGNRNVDPYRDHAA